MSNCMSIVNDMDDESQAALLSKIDEYQKAGMSTKSAQIAAVDAMLSELGVESDSTQVQRSAKDQTETPEFKEWFGNSVVVDKNGKPLVMYHGTRGDFDTFDAGRQGQSDFGASGRGFYFSQDPGTANVYATLSPADGAPNIVPVYLKLENPLELGAMLPQNEEQSRALTEAAKEAGHDGIVVRGADGVLDEVVVFRPEQIKSATGNNGNFDAKDPDITHSIRDLGFYSELSKQISNASMKQAPAADWKSFIKALSSKGVKADEIEWSGVNEFLDLKNGKVSKNELIDYLNSEGVQVEETVLTSDEKTQYEIRDEYGNVIRSFDDEVYAQDVATDWHREDGQNYEIVEVKNESAGKYAKYALPGGENYREVLLTIPGDEYKSPHWDQKNVVAHIRVDDRVDSNDDPVLFVQELQSDSAQDKRKGKTDWEAPFISTTDGWLNLALKRSIIMAVQGGYKKVAFIDGQQSADRYKLREREDGGAGMQAFYDKIVPNAVKGLLKKLGGGQLKSISIPLTRGFEGSLIKAPAKPISLNQLGFDVTPEMIKKVEAGVPLFSKRERFEAEDAGFDTSQVYYHGTTAKKDFKSFRYGKDGVDELGAGIYVTSDPWYAEAWAGRERPEMGGRIIPVVLKKGDLFDLESLGMAWRGPANEARKNTWEPLAQRILDRHNGNYYGWTDVTELADHMKEVGKRQLNEVLNLAGYIGAFNKNSQIPGQVVVFDARNIRSPWAKFNPKKVGSADILASARDKADIKEKIQKIKAASQPRKSGYDADMKHSKRVMYHGSPDSGYKSLEPDANGLTFVTPDYEVANSYANETGRNSGFAGFSPNVYEVEWNAKNTLDFTNLPPYTGESWQDAAEDFMSYPEDGGDFRDNSNMGWSDVEEFGGKKFFDELRKSGFDSIKVITNGFSEHGGNVEYASLVPGVIKIKPKDERVNLSAKDQTETPEFKKWFGDSKVVDADGKPLVVYHGTSANFSTFAGRRSKRAIWASASPETAFSYAGQRDGGNIMPLYIKMVNPLVIDADGASHDMGIWFEGEKTDPDFLEDIAKERGNDGIVIKNFVDNDDFSDELSDHYAVFDATQVKSATGNRGTFDGTDPDIRNSIRNGTSTWDAPINTGFDDLVYKMQDKLIDTKRVVKAISDSVGQIAEGINVYMQEELFHGRTAKRVSDFESDELKPLMEHIAREGYEMADVEKYLQARHAKEANALIASRDITMPDGGSGMFDAEVDDYFNNLSASEAQKLADIALKVDAIIAKTRQMYADYGLESQDTVDSWGQMFQHYVPLFREDKKPNGLGTGQGFSIKSKEVKSRTGSTQKVVDILAHIAMQRERLIVRGEKNRVSMALVGLAQSNPNPDFWTVGAPPSERVYDPKTKRVVKRSDPMYKSRDNVLVAKVRQADGSIKEMAVNFNERDDRAVRMAKALKNIDAGKLEGLLAVSAKITRYFSAINTQYNPVFGVVNLVRDLQTALINLSTTPLAGKRGRIAKDSVAAVIDIYRDLRAVRQGRHPDSQWSTLFEEFQNEGGQTGYRQMFATSKDRAEGLQKVLTPHGWMESKWGNYFTANGILKVPMSKLQDGAAFIFDWLSDYNESMENAVRLATYKAGLDQGMSKQSAASLAKNLTVNFNRKGEKALQAGALYAFFNAAMQGSARIGETLFDMDDGNIKTTRLSKVGKKIVYGGMLLGSMQALALAAAGFGDDDPPDFVRERSLIIPTGGKTYFNIPMPLGFHVIPGLGRHLTEFAINGFDKPAKRVTDIIGMFADAFNPIGNSGLGIQTIAPTVIDPLVALTENKDWSGRPIARVSSNKALPGHKQFKDSATWLEKGIAEAINGITGGNDYVAGVLSPTPDQIGYLLGQVGGGVAREASKIMQTVSSITTGEELPLYKIPLVGRFAGNAASQASQANSFYANVDKLNELETEVKGMRKDGKVQEAMAILRDHPEARFINTANVIERQIQKLRKEKRDLIAKNAPREAVKHKEEQVTNAMMRLNNLMASVEK